MLLSKDDLIEAYKELDNVKNSFNRIKQMTGQSSINDLSMEHVWNLGKEFMNAIEEMNSLQFDLIYQKLLIDNGINESYDMYNTLFDKLKIVKKKCIEKAQLFGNALISFSDTN